MSSAPPDLTVIIPAYNEAERLGATIRAVQSFLDAKGYGYEVSVPSTEDAVHRTLTRRPAWHVLTPLVGRPTIPSCSDGPELTHTTPRRPS